MKRSDDPKARHKAAMLLMGLAAPVAALQAGVTNYAYDELGRLVLVTDTRNGDRVFVYDPAGNRRQVIVGGSGQQPPPVEPGERRPPPGSRRAAVRESQQTPDLGDIVQSPLASFDEPSKSTVEAAMPVVGNSKER